MTGLVPLLHPIRRKPTPNSNALALVFPRFVLTTCKHIKFSFDWFIVLSLSLVIGLRDYFGFGFTTLGDFSYITNEYMEDHIYSYIML